MKKLVMLLAFAVVFIVRSEPIEAKSFDSPTLELAVDEGFSPLNVIALDAHSIKTVLISFNLEPLSSPSLIEPVAGVVDVGKDKLNYGLTTDIFKRPEALKVTVSYNLEANSIRLSIEPEALNKQDTRRYLKIKQDYYGLGGVASLSCSWYDLVNLDKSFNLPRFKAG